MPREYMPVIFAVTPVDSQNNSLRSLNCFVTKSFFKDHIMYNFIQDFSS